MEEIALLASAKRTPWLSLVSAAGDGREQMAPKPSVGSVSYDSTSRCSLIALRSPRLRRAIVPHGKAHLYQPPLLVGALGGGGCDVADFSRMVTLVAGIGARCFRRAS